MFGAKKEEKKMVVQGKGFAPLLHTDCHTPLQGSLLTNQNSMERHKGFDHCSCLGGIFVWPDFLGGLIFQPKILSDKDGRVL